MPEERPELADCARLMETEGPSRLWGMAPDRGEGLAVTLRMIPLSTGPLLGAFRSPKLLSILCLNPAAAIFVSMPMLNVCFLDCKQTS